MTTRIRRPGHAAGAGLGTQRGRDWSRLSRPAACRSPGAASPMPPGGSVRRGPAEKRAPSRGVPAGRGVAACWPAAAVRVQPGRRVLDGRRNVHREADRLPGKADERRVPRLNPGSLNSVADHDVPPHSWPPARLQPPQRATPLSDVALTSSRRGATGSGLRSFQLITESSAGLAGPMKWPGLRAVTPGQDKREGRHGHV